MIDLGKVSGHARLVAAGFALSATGVLVQAAAGVDLPGPVPPGAVVLALASALTLVVRWRWTLVGTALVAGFALLNVVEGPNLDAMAGGDGVGLAFGKWLMLIGAATALVVSWHGLLAVTRRDPAESSGSAGAAELADSAPRREAAWPRRLQIAALLVLAPVCAEYLAAYDDSTGDAVALIGALVIFIPLYGCPALLIREVCRRRGLGWVGIILLAAAFGLIEAGIVDQSLFSLDYRHIETWDEGVQGTFIGPLGFSAYNALNFVGGHVIYSICAPIALVEAFRPSRSHEPWLTPLMMGVVALLYAGASALVLGDSLMNETSHASPYQIAGSVVVVGLLVLAALRFGAPTTIRDDRSAPRVRTVFLAALVVATVYNASSPSWLGFAFSAPILFIAVWLMWRAAHSPDWSLSQVVAVASAALMTRAILSFTYFPVVGEVSAVRKFGHSVVFLILVTALCLLAYRATSRRDPSTFGSTGLRYEHDLTQAREARR